MRIVAPIFPNVRSPVAAVGEAPDVGGFGGEDRGWLGGIWSLQWRFTI